MLLRTCRERSKELSQRPMSNPEDRWTNNCTGLLVSLELSVEKHNYVQAALHVLNISELIAEPMRSHRDGRGRCYKQKN